MSKRETPLTRRFWSEVGGILIEEFMAVSAGKRQGRRLIDGLIIKSAETQRTQGNDIEVAGRDLIVVQTKASRLGMSLLGQVLFSIELMKQFQPSSIEGVAVCTKGDLVLEQLAKSYGIKVVVYSS